MRRCKEVSFSTNYIIVFIWKVPDKPVNYSMCGHFFCKPCVNDDGNSCPVCGILSCASEITSDRLITNLILGWRKISSTIGFESHADSLDGKIPEYEDSEKNRNSIKNKKSIKRTSEASTEKNISSRENQAKKKTRNSKSNIPPLTDTEKSSETTIVRKSRSTRSSNTLKDVNKRNVKGETQLHVACIKGKIQQVKNLLEDGANPNTKDYAGWTPLLESVNHGFIKITELLLAYGAMVNVPGCENVTSLHEAVLNNKLEMAKLLLMYGADIGCRDVNGLTPRDIAKTDEMKTILNSKTNITVMKPLIELKSPRLDRSKAVMYGCGLEKAQDRQLGTLARNLKLKLVHSYSSEVTHIIVPTNENNVCSAKRDVIQGILEGKWIVSYSWLEESEEMNDLIDPEMFEVKGTNHFPDSNAPKKGRTNAEKQFPGIFNGCHFYLAGVGGMYKFDDHKLTKTDMTTLIRSGNGVVLLREPDPESIPPGERTVPYHAPHNSVLAKCSHYVIYGTGKEEPKLKYNMTHIKSLPVQWLFECMERFSITEPMEFSNN
ncbi:BRCA1-associated RING domain protein 1-like isoform X1 [Periplaneta americana]|uniref:BRCA1-associated RING domain protein 1-like isoform X1 n=1 Tax=Periplaneta americana TaxID=6978 RepID=UPI0037E6F928